MPTRSAACPLPSPSRRTHCFSVTAEADPSALPRILGMVASLGLIPERCHVSRSEVEPDRRLLIDLQITDLQDRDAHLIEKKLERMLLVTQILCSEKRRVAA
ncbi:MAG: hypothetical protein ACR2QJ_14810 [Geminicoccaceae bacterium]